MEAIVFFLKSLRWQDIVDLLLNSFILFRLYVLFRGTILIRVITGLGLLWIAQRISGHFGLIVTSWLLQAIIAAGALIIIIVFRSEIRSVLQARNLKAIFWGVPRHALQTPVDAIVAAVYELARRRIGALMVIPGTKGLDELVQNGLAIDAAISKEMLISVFWPDNPIHDGAVILRDDRIQQAGAILPLSRREDLPSHYGTRHRAAAGLTEETDALVVVVSEETGRVAVARSGRLVSIDDNLSLARMLAEHTGRGSEVRAEPPAREVFNYATAALVSLLVVGGVWFSFARGQETLMTLDIPIDYLNRGTGMEIMDASATSAKLDVSGSGPLIRSLRPEQVKVQVDLAGIGAGVNTIALKPEMVRLPPGIKLKKVAPASLEVSLDAMGEKTVPVQVDWIGPHRAGTRLASAQVNPARVKLAGSQRLLAEIDTIYTQKVSLSGLESSGSLAVGLALGDDGLRVAPGAAERVTISYTVEPRQ
jgi:uncharacterized protein (TIGR00159 family)